jgi:hypothetical protein
MKDLDSMIAETYKMQNITYLKSFNKNLQKKLLDFSIHKLLII